jgi:hypothetical protein
VFDDTKMVSCYPSQKNWVQLADPWLNNGSLRSSMCLKSSKVGIPAKSESPEQLAGIPSFFFTREIGFVKTRQFCLIGSPLTAFCMLLADNDNHEE